MFKIIILMICILLVVIVGSSSLLNINNEKITENILETHTTLEQYLNYTKNENSELTQAEKILVDKTTEIERVPKCTEKIKQIEYIIRNNKKIFNTEENNHIKNIDNIITNTNLEVEKEPLIEKEDSNSRVELKEPEEATIGDKTFSVKELKEQIEFFDKLYGLKLAVKVNIPYMLSIMKDGINEETKEKIKVYLKEKLSEDEYNKVRELAYKYVHIFE